MLRGLAERLFRRAMGPSAGSWQARLADRGLDPFVLRTLAREPELAVAWERCPRVDWLLEVAIRAAVEPALVREGLAQLVAVLKDWETACGALETVLVRLDGEADPMDSLEMIGPALLASVDAAPEVRDELVKLRSAERWKDRVKLQHHSDAYDVAHAEAHGVLCDTFRRAVPLEALRFALEGQRAHPYR